MQATVLRYGLISGAILVGLMFLSMTLFHSGDTFDIKNAELVGYASMVVSLSLIFFGVRNYRDRVLGGSIRFWPAFKVGLLIALIASVCYVIGWMVYSHLIDPELMDTMFNQQLETARSEGKAEQVAEMEEFRALYQNFWVQIGVSFLEVLPVGIVIALISAGLLVRKKN